MTLWEFEKGKEYIVETFPEKRYRYENGVWETKFKDGQWLPFNVGINIAQRLRFEVASE